MEVEPRGRCVAISHFIRIVFFFCQKVWLKAGSHDHISEADKHMSTQPRGSTHNMGLWLYYLSFFKKVEKLRIQAALIT